MFEHLKVFNHKGLKECTLLNLGRINVICGRNNSGKSTLLEGINDPSKRDPGRSLDKEIARIHQQTGPRLGLGKDPRSTGNERYLKLLQTVMGKRVWYYGDERAFVEEIAAGFKQEPSLQRFSLVDANIPIAYQSLFRDPPKTVLLPPKRSLELRQSINTGAPAKPEGTGIINRIFHAKNQLVDSEDRLFYTHVCESFKKVSSGYNFDISTESDNNIIVLKFSYEDQSWISAEDSGLGLQDLLVILYFSLAPSYDVILLEEPESHMHPDMQRRLIRFLHDETPKQFFITTHSNIFLNSAFVDRVFFTRFDDSVKVDDATSRASILHDIGYDVTDNLVSDLVILVEGPTDIPTLEEFLIKWNLWGLYNIKIWPMGGDIMDQLDLSVFAQNYSIIGLVDDDPG